jgi:transposase-like protein
MINDSEFTVSDAPALWPGARVYRLACRHGVSSAALLPWRSSMSARADPLDGGLSQVSWGERPIRG